MGKLKNLYTESIHSSSESETIIEFKGKIYRDYSDDNGYTKYSIVTCPLCGGDLLKEYEKDETPGFRNSITLIIDRNCNCDLETYYKENNTQIYVRK